MGLSSIGFLIHESYLNIRRNGLMSLAALGTVTVALTVLGGSLWTVHRINEYVEVQPQKFNQVDVFLSTDVERTKAFEVQERLQQLPDVKTVRLVTKEQAWGKFLSEEPTITEAMEENPLPDKFELEASDVAKVGSLAKTIRDKEQFPEVAQVNDAGQEVRTLLSFARVIKVMGGGAAIGLFVATLFIVHNTIRLTVFARRREIRTMQLVGATPGFIRFPLLLEGIFHGVAGAAIAGGLILLCGREVSRFVAELHSPLIGEVPTRLTPATIMELLVGIGGAIGLVGSYLAMRRFLKQI